MPAGLGTLFAGLLLIVLAFVEGSSVWKSLHEVLFGLFGCGSFVLGAAVCYLAILYTRGEDLLGQVFKLLLGLIFASGRSAHICQGFPIHTYAVILYRQNYISLYTFGLNGNSVVFLTVSLTSVKPIVYKIYNKAFYKCFVAENKNIPRTFYIKADIFNFRKR